jgi:hypothetical protein
MERRVLLDGFDNWQDRTEVLQIPASIMLKAYIKIHIIGRRIFVTEIVTHSDGTGCDPSSCKEECASNFRMCYSPPV